MPKKTSKTKPTRVNWKKAAIALAKCVDFALRYDKHIGRGSGVMVTFEPDKKPRTLGPWQDQFFDALDMIGVVYDRKKYYASKAHKRRA